MNCQYDPIFLSPTCLFSRICTGLLFVSLSSCQYTSDEAVFVLFLCSIPTCSTETCSSITSISTSSVFCSVSLSTSNSSTSFPTSPVYWDQTNGSDFQYISSCSSTNWFQPISNYKWVLPISISSFLASSILSIYPNITSFLSFWSDCAVNPVFPICLRFLDFWWPK